MKEQKTETQILSQLNTRFLSIEEAKIQIANAQKITHQNSGTGRIASFIIGALLLVGTVAVVVATGRLFLILPVAGIGFIIRGFITQRVTFED